MKICSSASISYHCFLNSIMYVPEYSCWVEVRLEPKPSCMCGRTSLEQENCIFSGVVSHLNACRYHKVTIWPLWMSLCFHSLSTTTYKFSLWEQINNQSFAVPKQTQHRSTAPQYNLGSRGGMGMLRLGALSSRPQLNSQNWLRSGIRTVKFHVQSRKVVTHNINNQKKSTNSVQLRKQLTSLVCWWEILQMILELIQSEMASAFL